MTTEHSETRYPDGIEEVLPLQRFFLKKLFRGLNEGKSVLGSDASLLEYAKKPELSSSIILAVIGYLASFAPEHAFTFIAALYRGVHHFVKEVRKKDDL